jgi:hypothetical protein
VSQDGLVSLSLFYLVSICEGVLMPHLQPLVTLCEQQGHKGPLNNSGKYGDLEAAKKDFGPAIKFLATHGRPVFVSGSLAVGNRLEEYERDKLSRLRNSIAHFNFRLEIVRTNINIKDEPGFPKDPKQAALFEALYEGYVKSLHIHNPHRGQIVDSAKSVVRWEGALGKPVTKSSSSASFKAMRDTVGQVEAFAFSLAFAFLDAGSKFGSALVVGACQTCKEGYVVATASETHATCPACGTTHPLPHQNKEGEAS